MIRALKLTGKQRKKDSGSAGEGFSYYTVKKGDTLISIAGRKKCKWLQIYKANKETIEKAAKAHGLKNSDKGHWIFPGTKLKIPQEEG